MVNERNLNPSGREEKLSEKNIARLKKLAGVMAIASLSLTGCNSVEAKHEQTPEQSYSIEESEPTDDYDQESEVYEDSETEEDGIDMDEDTFIREPLPAELEKYKNMEPSEFMHLDIDEQYKYTSYLNQYRDEYMDVYSKYYYINEGMTGIGRKTKFNKPMTIGPDSKAIEVIQDQMWQKRLAAYPTIGTPRLDDDLMFCGQLDTDSTAKLLLASTRDNHDMIYPSSSEYTQSRLTIISLDSDHDQPNIVNGKLQLDEVSSRSICAGTMSLSYPDVFNPDSYKIVDETREENEFEGKQVTTVTIDYQAADPQTGERVEEYKHIKYRQSFHIVPVKNWKGESEYTTVGLEKTTVDELVQ